MTPFGISLLSITERLVFGGRAAVPAMANRRRRRVALHWNSPVGIVRGRVGKHLKTHTFLSMLSVLR
jgi:hypothetical protein